MTKILKVNFNYITRNLKCMKNKDLETLVQEVATKTIDIIRNSASSLREGYEAIHSKYPTITNYLSSAVGTIGGDAIAKQFTDNPDMSLRDVAFTASAAIVYSYLAQKMIEWSTKATNKVSKTWKQLKEGGIKHTLFNTTLLTAMYFPVNMVYWNYLTIKNQAPITWENNEIGAITLGIATIPYLVADYVAIKKFSKSETQKWLRPFYSTVELVWNTIFAGGNYIAKKM